MSTYRLTDNDRKKVEAAWLAVDLSEIVAAVEAIVAPIHARAEEAEAAGTEVARQMLLQVEAHRARAEAARAQVEEATDALIHLSDVAGMRVKAAEKRADDLAAVIDRVRGRLTRARAIWGDDQVLRDLLALLPDNTKETDR